jgi:hypothetical protein
MPLGSVTIGSAATPLWKRPQNAAVANVPSFQLLIVYNNGSNTMYIGDDAGVTSSTGIPIAPGGSITVPKYLDYDTLGDWYMAGTQGDVAQYVYR